MKSHTPPKKLDLRVEYIKHSGFLIETSKSLLVFDYYQGPLQLPPHKKIYVFSSHVHPDHFNPVIFQWQKEHPVHYILSSDIQGHPQLPQDRNNISFMAPYEEIRMDDLTIKTFGSTDVGVSFFLELEEKGTKLFHAGDLNWWHWWGEPQEDRENAEQMFKTEMAKIKKENLIVDLAFFPVDPRLEQYSSLGAEYFLQEIKPQLLIPMHFWDDYKSVEFFAEKMASSPTQVLIIAQPNQSFFL